MDTTAIIKMLNLTQYSARNFADSLKNLLPPGAAWQWPAGGFGDAFLLAQAQEFARIDANIQLVINYAVTIHYPANSSWTLADYRQVASDALIGITEALPRKMFAIGSKVSQRLWSINAPNTTFDVPLVQVDHLIGPFKIGSKVGEQLWGHRSRYIMRVRYYQSVVNPQILFNALNAFKQAHVFLWFEDITGAGGGVNYA